MDVEILLHGVPSGQDYYGLKEEQKLAESFYTSSIESVKIVVEARKNGTTPYVYYTYLRYKNIVGAGGRPGSYIGITLRLDMYYTDVILAYRKYREASLSLDDEAKASFSKAAFILADEYENRGKNFQALHILEILPKFVWYQNA